jgi:hypothetical protein
MNNDEKQELTFSPSAKTLLRAGVTRVCSTGCMSFYFSSRDFLSAIFQIITPKTAFATISATE